MTSSHPRRIASAAVAAGALLGTGALTTTAHAEPVEPVVERFDFQPAGAPVAEGFVESTRYDAYTPERGYGFTNLTGLNDRDRGSALDALRRDFVLPATGSTGHTFVVDVPNGEYDVTTWSGDAIASSRTAYTIEGVAYGEQSASSGTVNERVFDSVVVADGQLTVQVHGGSPRLNGIQVLSPLAAPTGLTASADAAAPSATLSWDAMADVEGYRLYRTAPGGQAELVTEQAGTTYTDTGVTLAAEYSYHVAAVAQGREGDASAPVQVRVVDPDVAPPAAPENLAVTDIAKEVISLSWTGDDTAVAYDVQRATSPEGPFTTVARVDGTSYTDEDVFTTIEYFYRVVAVNAGGLSEPSAVLTTEAVTTLVRQAEYLDRAPVAVQTADGVYVGWRHLGTDPDGIAFHVYRDGVRLTDEPVTGATNLLDDGGTTDSTYRVTVVTEDTETDATEDFGVWADGHLDIPLNKPADGVTNGQSYSYSAGDASVGDLDGDGTYEVVLIWNPSNSKDNSQAGYTGNVYVDAYTLTGEQLWRIDLGKNIRAGAHYSQPMVYDLDGDGKAEVVMKTADGTTDGAGTVIGDPNADHRNSGGYILTGPEFLTLFDGETGAAVDTVDYVPGRGNVGSWGDTYGNRVDRFLSSVAYLDGEHPSVIFSRGYYTRSVVAAWDVVDDQLVQRWVFDTNEAGKEYEGQGNHQMSVADADGDSKDEILFGSLTIDDDGTVLNSSGLGHGDAMHVSDHIPSREGLEVFQVHECMSCSGNRAAVMRDTATGEVIWEIPGTRDTGRGAAADIDPRYAGAEAWAVGGDAAWNSSVGHLMTAEGQKIGDVIPPANFLTWWDGDLLREVTDHSFDAATQTGTPTVSKWDHENGELVQLLNPTELRSNNGTKGNPSLQADLFGDWREELVYRTADSSALRVLTTTDLTEHRLRTLMHDPVYRLGVAWQLVGYNQPPHTSFFLGEGMEQPPAPSIATAGALDVTVPPSAPGDVRLNDDNSQGTGAHDGDYTVTATMNEGQNGTVFRLYENGVVIHSQLLDDATPARQVVEVPVTGRANGTYTYVAEYVNAAGTTTSPERTVKVKAAG